MPLGALAVAGRALGSEVQGAGLSLGTPSRLEAPTCLIALQVMEELQAASVHSDERELLQLLSTPHLRVVTPQSLPTHTACVS